MKKKVILAVMIVIVLSFSVPTFATENTDLPYVENLGYEVVIPDADYSKLMPANYNSGWKKFLGGSWIHGVGNRYVWSKYDHKYKVHKTTVQGAGGKLSSSGWTVAGRRAEASWERAVFGNKAWATVK